MKTLLNMYAAKIPCFANNSELAERFIDYCLDYCKMEPILTAQYLDKYQNRHREHDILFDGWLKGFYTWDSNLRSRKIS